MGLCHTIQILSVADIAFPNLCDSVDGYNSREFEACIILYLFNYVKAEKKENFKEIVHIILLWLSILSPPAHEVKN